MKSCLMRKQGILCYFVLAIIIIITVSAVKYREGEINYLNSDATWHTLLTMQAYDETPASQHKFLPIVSLGGEDDKFIPWGSTIPDEYGNYYYTSFSPAGYVLPYIFVKVFNLPINEKGIYVFNTFLFIISSILWVYFLSNVFKNSKSKYVVMFVGMMSYIFSPEILHGMGIVYWHQSVMQVTLLLQILLYYLWKTRKSNKAKYVFLLMTVINPYIEWTGYIANVGFALAELVANWKSDRKKGLKNAVIIGFLTVLSFCLFTIHFLSTVSSIDFFTAIKNRFFARNFASSTSLIDVFSGYLTSFLFLWLLLFVVIVWSGVKNGMIEFRHKLIALVLLFPLVENIVMKQHALAYTYDRMKMIFILSFVISELVNQVLEGYHRNKKLPSIIVCVFTTICCFSNLIYYISDDRYIWEINYRNNNELISKYINDNYSDSVIVTNAPVRGYLNLLFDRGIYELEDIDSAISLASASNRNYGIEIIVEEDAPWNMYKVYGATIYNLKTKEYQNIKIQSNGSILVK